MNAKIATILINWNSYRDTIECVNSILKNSYLNNIIIIVDNNSSDNSVEEIKNWCESRGMLLVASDDAGYFKYTENNRDNAHIWIIQSSTNRGFAGGNNLGIKLGIKLCCEYFLLLNNDTVISDNCINEAVSAIKQNSNIGILGAKIYYYHDPNRIWYFGGGINWFRMAGYHKYLNEIDNGHYVKMQLATFITGCFMLISREVLNKVGLLPEDYFLYFEDLHYSIIVGNAGYDLVVIPSCSVWHKEGVSTRQKDKRIFFYHYYLSKYKFINKFAGYKKIPLFITLTIFLIFSAIKKTIVTKNNYFNILKKIWHDFIKAK